MKHIALLLLFISCANIKNQQAYLDGENYYKLKDTNRGSSQVIYPLRDKEGRDEAIAKSTLESYKSMTELERSRINTCNGSYQLSKKLHQIINTLDEKKQI